MIAGKAQALEGEVVKPGYESSTQERSRRASARRLSFIGAALAASIFVLIPVAFDPTVVIAQPWKAFDLTKLELLVKLSAALLAAVLGALVLGDRPYSVPVLLPALAFLGVSTLSTLFSGDILHSLVGEVDRYDGLLSLAAGVLVFYAAAVFLDSWAKVRVFLVAGITSAVIVSVYGLSQMFGLDPVLQMGIPWAYMQEPVTGHLSILYSYTDRVFSTVGYPISLAAYLTLMMGATLALYFKTQARWERWVWLAVMALMGACWLYTYTRGAMLGCAVALPVVLFLAYRRLGSIRPLLVPVAVMLVGVLAAHLANPQSMNVFDRFAQTNLAATPEEMPEGGDLSVTTRLLMWRDIIPVIAERPLIGHGPDNFIQPFKRHEGEDLKSFFPQGTIIDKAHNELLQVAATTGLLGLAAYLWIFISYFRHAYRSGGWALLALSGGVLAYILQLQTWVTSVTTGVTFWALLGVSVAVMRIQEGESKATLSAPENEQASAPSLPR